MSYLNNPPDVVIPAGGGGSPSGPASGDLGSSYPGPTVVGIGGLAITNSPGASGQVLTYDAGTNNIQWENQQGGSGGSGNVTGPNPAQVSGLAYWQNSTGTELLASAVLADASGNLYIPGGIYSPNHISSYITLGNDSNGAVITSSGLIALDSLNGITISNNGVTTAQFGIGATGRDVQIGNNSNISLGGIVTLPNQNIFNTVIGTGGMLVMASGSSNVVSVVMSQVSNLNPTLTNDQTQGYSQFSLWLNSGTPSLYICLAPNAGNAKWGQVTGQLQSITGDIMPSGTNGSVTVVGINGLPMTMEGTSERQFPPAFDTLAATAFSVAASGTAYFNYLGRTANRITPQYVYGLTSSAGTVTSAQVGLFSTPGPPKRNTSQTLTKIVAGAVTTPLGSNAPYINTSAFATVVPSGTYLWAGMVVPNYTSTAPAFAGCLCDFNAGTQQKTTAAGPFTANTSFTGTINQTYSATVVEMPFIMASLD